MRVYADHHVAPARRGAACPNSAEANFHRDGDSQSPRTRTNVLKCGLKIATQRDWSGRSGNSYIRGLVQGLEPDLESKDGSKGRR